MEGGSEWDGVLEKLTNSLKHLLHRKTRQQIAKFCVENKMTRSAAEEYLKKFEKSKRGNGPTAEQKIREALEKGYELKFEESFRLITESIFSMDKCDRRLPDIYSLRSVLLKERGFILESSVDKYMQRERQSGLPDIFFDYSSYYKELEESSDMVLSKKVNLPELAGGKNENFVSASKYLSVHYDETRGRHVIANEDIKMGDVLFVEEPFSHIWFAKDCHNCLKETVAPIPCLNCPEVTYCSPACRDEFWTRVHSFECGFSKLFKSVGIGHMALRVVLNASSSLDELKKIIEGISEPEYTNEIVKYNSKGYDSVYQLAHNNEAYKACDMFQYAMTALLLALYLRNWTNYFPPNSGDEDLELLTSVICLHITQLVCNGSRIEKIYANERDPLEIPGDSELKNRIIYQEVAITGTAIYPSLSMLNHSCEPSIINRKWAITRARKDIKKGEEVFNCYGPSARYHDRAYRQEHLMKQYCFQCKCVACTRPVDLQDIFSATKCTSCNGPAILDIPSKCRVCVTCGEISRVTTEFLSKILKVDSLLQDGLKAKDLAEGLRLCLESWRLGRQLYYKFNKDLYRSAREVSQFFVHFEEYEKCISFLKCCLLSVEARFGSFSMELATELDLIGSVIISFCSKSTTSSLSPSQRAAADLGLEYLDKAKQIFYVIYGADFDGFLIQRKRRFLEKVLKCAVSPPEI